MNILVCFAVPSDAPQNLTVSNTTKNSITAEWLQVESSKLHGIFRKFKININETLSDGTPGIAREFSADTNVSIHAEINSTDTASSSFNVTRYFGNIPILVNGSSENFALSFIGLRPYTNYTVSVSACTSPGCGIAAIIKARTDESCKFISY